MKDALIKNPFKRSRNVFAALLVLGLGACVIPANSFAFAFTSGQSASIVLGQPNFTTSSTATSQGGLHTRVVAYNGPIFDSSGNLWISDESNHRILEFPKGSGFTNGESASLVIGQSDFFSNTAANPPTAASLRFPQGIVFDSSGNLWVADANNNRILEFTTPFSTDEAASLVIGQGASFTTNTANNGGLSASSLASPQSISFDSSGNLWVADVGNNRVLEFPKGSGFTSGESASLVIGQSSFSGGSANQGASTSADSLSLPQGIAFDSSGNLWVTDRGNSRVLEFTTPFSTDEAASLVIGQSSFSGGSANQGASTSADSLSLPQGIAFDSSGNLWIGDTSNNRVLEFTTPFSTDEVASTVFGQGASFTSNTANNGGLSASSLASPQGISFDSSGNLWISDTQNNRVLEYLVIAISLPEFPLGGMVLLVIASMTLYAGIRYKTLKIR